MNNEKANKQQRYTFKVSFATAEELNEFLNNSIARVEQGNDYEKKWNQLKDIILKSIFNLEDSTAISTLQLVVANMRFLENMGDDDNE